MKTAAKKKAAPKAVKRTAQAAAAAPITNSLRTLQLPALGAYWPGQGGLFAGLMTDEHGKEYALIKAEKEIPARNFDTINKLAADVVADGHKDFKAMDRREGRLLWINLKHLFKNDWYWTCEQPPESSSHAVVQHFGDGDQIWTSKGSKCHGCAVRRVYSPI